MRTNHCVFCGVSHEALVTYYAIPISLGGGDTEHNIIKLCPLHHRILLQGSRSYDSCSIYTASKANYNKIDNDCSGLDDISKENTSLKTQIEYLINKYRCLQEAHKDLKNELSNKMLMTTDDEKKYKETESRDTLFNESNESFKNHLRYTIKRVSDASILYKALIFGVASNKNGDPVITSVSDMRIKRAMFVNDWDKTLFKDQDLIKRLLVDTISKKLSLENLSVQDISRITCIPHNYIQSFLMQ